MMCGLNCAILMRALLKSNLLVRTLTIDSIKHSQKPGESLDDCFARFKSIVSNFVLVVLLLILIMNVLNNSFMLLMIMCGV
jgi:hypothetical protein